MEFRSAEELCRIGSLKWTGIKPADGSDVLGAWVAEMDFGTAPCVEKVMVSAIQDGLLGYNPTWLAPEVSEATAAFQKKRFGWDLDPKAVRVAPAVLPALEAMIQYLVRPGSPVIVPTPAYMPFLTIPPALGHSVIEVPSLHGDAYPGGWTLDLDGIKAGLEAGAGLVILCNPWNPVGRVLTEVEMRALQELVSRYDALVFSDEIHSPLVLGGRDFVSYARMGAEFASHTITATAATKGWNIAGLPNAQVIIPDEGLRERWDRICQEKLPHSMSTIGALGTIEAYTNGDEWQREIFEVIEGNIRTVTEALAPTEIDFRPPQATYLTWWGFEAYPQFGDSPASVLLERAHIAVNAGITLGANYSKWARMNLACPPKVVEEMLSRVLDVL